MGYSLFQFSSCSFIRFFRSENLLKRLNGRIFKRANFRASPKVRWPALKIWSGWGKSAPMRFADSYLG